MKSGSRFSCSDSSKSARRHLGKLAAGIKKEIILFHALDLETHNCETKLRCKLLFFIAVNLVRF